MLEILYQSSISSFYNPFGERSNDEFIESSTARFDEVESSIYRSRKSTVYAISFVEKISCIDLAHLSLHHSDRKCDICYESCDVIHVDTAECEKAVRLSCSSYFWTQMPLELNRSWSDLISFLLLYVSSTDKHDRDSCYFKLNIITLILSLRWETTDRLETHQKTQSGYSRSGTRKEATHPLTWINERRSPIEPPTHSATSCSLKSSSCSKRCVAKLTSCAENCKTASLIYFDDEVYLEPYLEARGGAVSRTSVPSARSAAAYKCLISCLWCHFGRELLWGDVL